MSNNNKLHSAIQKAPREYIEDLVTRVKKCADAVESSLTSRHDLYFQIEPFTEEFGQASKANPNDRQDVYGYRFNEMAKTAIIGKKYRSSLFAWLSYYHPNEAEDFRLKLLSKVGIDVPHYYGHPKVAKLSDEANRLFDFQEHREIPESNIEVLEAGKLVVDQRRQETFRKVSLFLGLVTLIFIALIFRHLAIVYSYNNNPSKFESYWGEFTQHSIVSEQEFDKFDVITVDGKISPALGRKQIDYFTTTFENGFYADGNIGGVTLTSQGAEVKTTATQNGYTGRTTDFKKVFELILTSNGNYKYKQYRTLDHGKSEDKDSILSLNFGITSRLNNGDDKAGGRLIIQVKDSTPNATTTFCAFHEANIAYGQNKLQGTLRIKGGQLIDFGPDEGGYIHIEGINVYDDLYIDNENVEYLSLTSRGRPVEFDKPNENKVIGKFGDSVIFIFAINRKTGAYEYIQYAELDQPKKNKNGMFVILHFKIHVHDRDGNHLETAIDIDVYDSSHGKGKIIVNGLR